MSFVPRGNDPFSDEARRSKWLMPNMNVTASIESAVGYDAVMLAHLDKITNHSLPTHGLLTVEALNWHPPLMRYSDLIGAKYLIVPIEVIVPDDLIRQYPPVFENRWTRVLLNESAFPRLFHVPQFENASSEQAVDVMAKGTWNGVPFDPHSVVLVENLDREQLDFDPAAQAFGSTLFLMDFELIPGVALENNATGDWQLVTWWACQTPIQDNFTLYVHFVDKDGQMVAQADHLLGMQTSFGMHPTQAWACPALLADRISIPSSVLSDPSSLRIAIGIWKPETGARLAPEPGNLAVDDHGRVLLGQVSDMVSNSLPAWNVTNLERGADWVSAVVNLARGGVVVHGSNYSAGWLARVDGEPVPVMRVDGFLQGVYVPAGNHHLEFVYRPVWFRVGAAVSILTLGLLILVFWHKGVNVGATINRHPNAE
jgi:hypothetical protein